MKLSISNIAWKAEQDYEVYNLMKKYNFQGLEIAPTRIFAEKPYEQLNAAAEWSSKLYQEQGFVIPSMQSIWFGKSEKIFGSLKERKTLLDYTNKAVDFAEIIGCKNLVFGCPGNRFKPENASDITAYDFFKAIGDYANSKGIKIGIEANPPIYNTNYINTTLSAIELIKTVNSNGLGLNLDFGTIIHNNEELEVVSKNTCLISHVHISEPGLAPIQKRQQHKELANILKRNNYKGFVSIEMKAGCSLEYLAQIMAYVKEVFA